MPERPVLFLITQSSDTTVLGLDACKDVKKKKEKTSQAFIKEECVVKIHSSPIYCSSDQIYTVWFLSQAGLKVAYQTITFIYIITNLAFKNFFANKSNNKKNECTFLPFPIHIALAVNLQKFMHPPLKYICPSM